MPKYDDHQINTIDYWTNHPINSWRDQENVVINDTLSKELEERLSKIQNELYSIEKKLNRILIHMKIDNKSDILVI